jgi:hypothetical protein
MTEKPGSPIEALGDDGKGAALGDDGKGAALGDDGKGAALGDDGKGATLHYFIFSFSLSCA